MPLLLLIILLLPGVASAISVDDLVNKGIPLECLAWDNNWVVEPPTDPVPPPPTDPVPPPTVIGADVGTRFDACNYDVALGVASRQCPRRVSINGVGSYLEFRGYDLRSAACVSVGMANEKNRGITVRVDGSAMARVPATTSWGTYIPILELACDNCTVQLYQDGSFPSDFVWLYNFRFLDAARCP